MFIGNSVWAGPQKSNRTPSGSYDNPLWMRYSAISPNGNTIAFTYKGDIYTVPTTGGRASIITTNPAYDTQPIWSKDGKSIAFASDRMGSMDVYLVSSEGGTPTRLTTHSVNETPIAFIDNETILFSANILPSAESSQFPSGQFSQIYAISVKGALENSNYVAQRPVMYSTLPMEYISFSNDGKTLLYNDKKGYEDPWRKHHTSSITRDIWLCTAPSNTGIQPAKAGTYSKVTTFKGEDRNPVFAPDGKSFYFLSEQDGTFNVYKGELGVNNSFKQVTNFKGNPVRFLSLANNGTLCFGYDGEIYTLKDENGKISTPQKVDIKIISDKIDRDLVKQVVTRGADDMAVSKDGKQIAFIYHGDVYVTSSEYK
ncbi:MAG: hypothetical protein RR770_08690, partial [Bacteroidales bacterium]